MKLHRFIRLVFFCALAAAPLDAQEEVRYISSPFRSLERTRELLDVADLKVMLPLGYELQYTLSDPSSSIQEEGLSGRLKNRKGLKEVRRYYKRIETSDDTLFVELAIVAKLQGGYELLVYSDVENKDLLEVHRLLDGLLKGLELGYEMYRLGHIEAAQALALLKALGYKTMEFKEYSNGSQTIEDIFHPILEQGHDADGNLIDAEADLVIIKDQLPIIINVMGASKTSLIRAGAPGGTSQNPGIKAGQGLQILPQLGGALIEGTTAGEPQERLLIVHARNDTSGALEELINLLQEKVDVAAQQIVIEALVVEINSSHLRDMGIEFSSGQEHVKASFEPSDQGLSLPFIFEFSHDAFEEMNRLKGQLEFLADTGQAEILSSPSVLVLNDRQARIQIGQQIPLFTTTTSIQANQTQISYMPVGIVLNLRPRINADGSEVTMQVETIVSSVSRSSALPEVISAEVPIAPIVDNRQVQSYVRVADGTPFIIGGLLSTDKQERTVGLPLISTIPVLGYLFKRERTENVRREVIVVFTPHIVPQEDPDFSYLIPKDSATFDRFGTHLFRNVYRVRDDDILDFKFIQKSSVLEESKVASVLEGSIPGEEILVRRMLYNIIDKLNYGREVSVDHISLLADSGKGAVNTELNEVLGRVLGDPKRAAMLVYEPFSKESENYLNPPVATVRDTLVEPENQRALLGEMNVYDEFGNPHQLAIVLADAEDVERLGAVLVLKTLLELNRELERTLQVFRPGLQILFPSREEMRSRHHLIDREVARLFYETEFYYPVFAQIFNQTINDLLPSD